MRNSSLDRLVVEHLPPALRFATRLTGEVHAAEEIVQDALLRVLRSRKDFRGEAAFQTWLFRIVINVFRDSLRKKASNVEVPIDENPVEPADASGARPPQAAMAAEFETRIAQEVSRLPPRQREVLVLSVYEGMSTGAVAELLDISHANVHATLSAARSRLKDRLAPYFKSIER